MQAEIHTNEDQLVTEFIERMNGAGDGPAAREAYREGFNRLRSRDGRDAERHAYGRLLLTRAQCAVRVVLPIFDYASALSASVGWMRKLRLAGLSAATWMRWRYVLVPDKHSRGASRERAR